MFIILIASCADNDILPDKPFNGNAAEVDSTKTVGELPEDSLNIKYMMQTNSDLIISDIRMPEMRGDEFLEWIKSNQLFKHIPVVMLSSEDSTTERIRLLQEGAEDYIVKPFNPMELKVRIKKIIE